MLHEVVCRISSRTVFFACAFFAAIPERNFSYPMDVPGEPGQKDVLYV